MILQNLYAPDADKDQKWCANMLQQISQYGINSVPFNYERYKTFKNYEFVKGVYDMAPLSYMVNTTGGPLLANWRHVDFLRVKLEKTLGDYLDHPLSYYAHITNKDGIERKVGLAAKVATHKVTQPHQAMVANMTGVDVSDPSVAQMSPQDQEAAMNMTYKDALEEFGENALNYLINRYDIDAEFVKCLWDRTICAKAFTRVKVVNGDPIAKRVDPRSLIWDCDIDSNTLGTSAWMAEERYLTVSQILQEGGRNYPKKTIEALKSLSEDYVTSLIKNNPSYGVYYKVSSNGGVRLRVIDSVWCSTRQKEFFKKETTDKDNPIYIEVTDEKKEESKKWYKKAKENGTIVMLEGDDWWEGRMMGHDTYGSGERMSNQPRSQSYGYAVSPSPYKGVISNAIDGITSSMVDRAEPILIMLDETMYNIDFLLGRTNGKVLQYDIAQQPDNLTKAQVMTMAKNHGFVFVDSRKEGVRSNAFNQFSNADMSNTADIVTLINVAMSLESMVDNVLGTNRGWTGDTKASDTLGNTQNDVMQANSIMRPLYYDHSRLIEQSLNGMADLLKYANWEENGRMSYILDDGLVKMFSVPEGFRLDDLGVKFVDGYKGAQDMQAIKQMTMSALASGSVDYGTALDVSFGADTATEAIRVFKKGLAVMQQQRAQQQGAEQQLAQGKIQSDQLKSQTQVEVAKINASAVIASTNIKESNMNDRNQFDKEFEATLEDKKSLNKLHQIALDRSADPEQLPTPQKPA